MMSLVADDLCWATFMTFTMSASFHVKEVFKAFDFTFGNNQQQQSKYNMLIGKADMGVIKLNT